jgi:hypothetical protein
MPVSDLDLAVCADHNQFYVCDEGPWEGTDHLAPANDMLWVGAAAEDRIDVRPGTIAVLTKTDGYVRVRIERLHAEPEDNPERHDHVVEASLESRSGTLVVIEETAEVGKLTIGPAIYRARVCWDGLDQASEVNLEPENATETIRIELWPETERIEPRVLKWYWEWKPKPPEKRPENPHGLRVLVGEREIDRVLARYPFTRVMGYDPQPDGTRNALIRDQDGNLWERVYSEEPPYEPVMFELPASEIRRFEPL